MCAYIILATVSSLGTSESGILPSKRKFHASMLHDLLSLSRPFLFPPVSCQGVLIPGFSMPTGNYGDCIPVPSATCSHQLWSQPNAEGIVSLV